MADNWRMVTLNLNRGSLSKVLTVLLALAILPACSSSPVDDDDSGTDDDDDDDDDDDSAPEYSNPFGLYPVPGAVDVSTRTLVFADAAEAELLAGATLTLTSAARSEVPVEISEVSSIRLVGRPIEALADETEYSVTVSFPGEDNPHEWSFTTGFGPPIVGEVPEVQTLQLNAADFVVLSPFHPESPVAFEFALPKLLFQISEADGSLSAFGGAVDEWGEDALQQSLCQPTWAATGGTWADPYFEFTSFSIPYLRTTEGQPVPFSLLEASLYVSRLSGAFVEDSKSKTSTFGLLQVEIDGHVDVRDFGMGDVCQMRAELLPGTVCEACPGEPEAMECVYLWGLGGTAMARPDIQEITELTGEEIVAGDCYPEAR